MANKIVVKHRSADIGEPSDLLAGEIAANINAAGKKLYIGTGTGNIVFPDQSYTDATYLTSETSHADVVVDGDFASSGLMTTDGAGVYSITTLDTSTSLGTSDTAVPTQNAVKSYVDSAVAGGVNYQGAYDASTNTPDLDTTPSGVLKGHMYTVTVAGTFFTVDLEVGDVLIAEIDNAAAEADWTIVQRNIIDDTLVDGGTF